MRDDDSILSSLAGVPLTRMARIATCVIWAAFWLARVLLTDALAVGFSEARPLVIQLIGENPFDQGFSIVMAWLTVEVVPIVLGGMKGGIAMLIAKWPTKSLSQEVAERLRDDEFRNMAARRLTVEDLETLLAEKKAESRQQDRGRRRRLRGGRRR